MSSSKGPNLNRARAKIENLMDDACVATLDTEGERDDVLDLDTGQVGKPASDDHVRYDASSTGEGGRSLADQDGTGGKCKIKPASQSSVASLLAEGGQQITTEIYVVAVPLDAPSLPNGTDVHCVSSRRDPLLPGQHFKVRRPEFGTFVTQRKYLAELRPSL